MHWAGIFYEVVHLSCQGPLSIFSKQTVFKNQDIQISEEVDYFRVVYRGEMVYDATTEMLRELAQRVLENNKKRLLFDLRGAKYDHYHISTIRHAEEAPALGIDKSFRIAILGHAGNQMLNYMENVGVNRGFNVKTFTDEPAAVEWLHDSP